MYLMYAAYAENGIFHVCLNEGIDPDMFIVTCTRNNLPISHVLGSVRMGLGDAEYEEWIRRKLKKKMAAQGITSISKC